jgi:hypothetical protein
MSRAARAASPVRDPPGAALTWVRRCLAVWEGRDDDTTHTPSSWREDADPGMPYGAPT